MAQVPPFVKKRMGILKVSESPDSLSFWQYGLEDAHWLQLLTLFIAAKELNLSELPGPCRARH